MNLNIRKVLYNWTNNSGGFVEICKNEQQNLNLR